MSAGKKKSVLFVCLGNICRSPIAEAVFRQMIKERGVNDKWRVDSAAIGPWHIGCGPDQRAIKTLKDNGIDYDHKVRQVRSVDFADFDFIFGMDDENMSDLKRIGSASSSGRAKSQGASVELLGSYDPDGERIIEDPYYQNGDRGFVKCYHQCVRCCKAFLDSHQ